MLIKLVEKLKYYLLYIRFGITYIPDKIIAINFFQFIIKLINFKEYKIRKKILPIKEDIKIENNIGFKVVDEDLIFNNDQLKSLRNLKEKYDYINWNDGQDIDRRKPFLLTKDINIEKDVKNIIDGILPIASNYIGSLPVLLNVQYWYSSNKISVPNRSQSWHMDQGDLKNLKIMIPIDDVTNDSGPLNVIPAFKSNFLFKKLIKKKIVNKRNKKLSDDVIENNMEENNFQNAIIMKKNQIGFADTCRCYHYGSRIGKRPRKLIVIWLVSAYSLHLPLFRRKINFSDYLKDNKSLVYAFINNNFYSFRNIITKKWDFKIL
jgi:hypothetical protein